MNAESMVATAVVYSEEQLGTSCNGTGRSRRLLVVDAAAGSQLTATFLSTTEVRIRTTHTAT